MTKRHFIAFAEYIRVELVNQGKLSEAKATADAIAHVAYSVNPRFDFVRFSKACGLSTTTDPRHYNPLPPSDALRHVA